MLAAWTALFTLSNIFLWMLTAAVALNASEWRGAWQAADSHSCRDQGKIRGGSAWDLSLMVQGRGGSGIIPTFANSRAVRSSVRAQAPSLGNINWSQELLQPKPLGMPQPETTTTTQQHNNTPPPKSGAAQPRAGDTDSNRKKNRGGAASGRTPAAEPRSSSEQEEGAASRPSPTPPEQQPPRQHLLPSVGEGGAALQLEGRAGAEGGDGAAGGAQLTPRAAAAGALRSSPQQVRAGALTDHPSTLQATC